MRRFAWALGLLVTTSLALTACGDDGGGGGGDDGVDGGFDAGPNCASAGAVCSADRPCCSGPCPASGTCPVTCDFDAQCETGCCAPNPEANGLPTCQELSACFDGTQGRSCELFAAAMCAYSRQDFGTQMGCNDELVYGHLELANCERDWKAGCCGEMGCDRPSWFDVNQVTQCVNAIQGLACPGAQSPPCTADCFYSDVACGGPCRTCQIGVFDPDSMTCFPPGTDREGPPCIFSIAGGTASCAGTDPPIVPLYAPPFPCRGIQLAPE